MLFFSRRGRRLFAPNGIWGRTCYVIADEATARHLKRLNRLFVLLTFLVFILSIFLDSWWLLIAGIGVLVFLQAHGNKLICRQCEQVEEKITFKNVIEDFARSRKRHELWITALAFPALAIYQGWKMFEGPEDFIWEVLSLLVFSALTIVSIYATILREKG